MKGKRHGWIIHYTSAWHRRAVTYPALHSMCRLVNIRADISRKDCTVWAYTYYHQYAAAAAAHIYEVKIIS